MDFRFTAHDPGHGGFLYTLPRPSKVQIGDVFGTRDTLELSYSSMAANAAEIPTFVEIRMEVQFDGGAWEQAGPSFLRLGGSHEDTDQAGMRTVQFVSREWLLGKARVGPGQLELIDGKRPFYQSSPGAIMRTLILEAQDRGAADGIELGPFNASQDSAGNSWGKVATIYYSPGLPIGNVLENLVDQGLCEYRMEGRTLHLYEPETTMGRDLTTGDNPTRVHGAITEAPVNYTLQDLATNALLIGEEGFELEVSNDTAPDDYGRLEVTIEQGGVNQEGTARVLIDGELQRGSREIREITRSQSATGAAALPYRDYLVGDYVQALDRGEWERYRVREIQITRDGQEWTVHTVLNDRLQEFLLKLAKRTNGIVNGSQGSGGDGTRPTPPPNPGLEPRPPQGLVIDQQVYLNDQGVPRGVIYAGFGRVTESTTGQSMDIGGYELWGRPNVSGATWRRLEVSSTDEPELAHSPVYLLDDNGEPAQYQWAVRALAQTSLRPSGFSNIVTMTMTDDVEPPPAPSTPGVRVHLRIIYVEWDGLDREALPMPRDFRRLRIHFADSEDMADARHVGTLEAAGGWNSESMPVDVPVWVAISAVDWSGNESTLSTAVEVVPEALVNDDSFQDALDDLKRDIDNIIIDAEGTTTYQTPYEPDETTDPPPKRGDLWFDTSDNMRLHRHDGEGWVSASDGRIDAIQDAQDELREDIENIVIDASGATTYWLPTEPDSSTDPPPKQGDLWFDTSEDGGNQLYRYDGDQWVSAADERIDAIREAQDELEADIDRVRTSVDGKNSVTQSVDAPPSQYDGAVNDVWERMSSMGSGGQVVSRWRWNGNVWVSYLLSDAVFGNIDASKIGTGFLDAARIQAGSIYADKIVSGLSQNMVPDPGFTNSDISALRLAEANSFGAQWSISDGVLTCDATGATLTGAPNISFAATRDLYAWAAYPGMDVRSSLEVRVIGGNAALRVNIRFSRRDGSVAYTRMEPGNYRAISGQWQQFDATYQLPWEAVGYSIVLQLDPAVTTGVVEIRSPFSASAVGGTVIQDGAITTGKIATGSITAESGIIASLDAGVITAGTLDAARIGAKSITADKILIGSSTNLIPGAESWASSNAGWTQFGWTQGSGTLTTTGENVLYTDEPFFLASGEYMLEARISSSGGNGRAYVGIYSESWPDTGSSGYRNVLLNFNGDAAEVFVMPEGGAEVTLRVITGYQGSLGDTGTSWISRIALRPRVGATLIQDGAITTDKIDAGAITADKIAVSGLDAGSIRFGEMDGARIKAGTITTDQLLITKDETVNRNPKFLNGDAGWEAGGSSSAVWRWELEEDPPYFVMEAGYLPRLTSEFFPVRREDSLDIYLVGERVVTGSPSNEINPVVRVDGRQASGNIVSISPLNRSIGSPIRTDARTGANVYSISVDSIVTANVVDVRVQLAFPASSTRYIGQEFRVYEFAATKKVIGTMIADGAITTDKIAANAITADNIEAGAIQAGHLSAGAITAENIEAINFNGVTITGATIRTSANNQRVEMNDQNLRQYDANSRVVTEMASGNFRAIGSFQTGHETERRVIINNSVWNYGGAGAGMIFVPSGGSYNAPYESRVGSPGNNWIEMAAQEANNGMRSRFLARNTGLEIMQSRLSGRSEGGQFGRINIGSSTTTAADILLHTGTVSGSTRTTWNDIRLGAQDVGIGVRRNLVLAGIDSGSGTSLNIISGSIVRQGSSSRRFKLVEEPLPHTLPDFEDRILSLTAKTWFDKGNAERYAEYLSGDSSEGEEKETLTEKGISPISRVPGLIAEEVHEAGLGIFVNYDEDGEPFSLKDAAFGMALIPIVKRLRDRITELEERINQ